MPDEEPLAGGNVSAGVVRVGDTVRRPAGPWTPAVHALLTYLRAAGFDGAPEPLGLDDKGREVLRFIPGTVAWGEGFRLLQPASELARAGRLIRDFHDAVTGFAPPSDAHWQVGIPPDRAEIIAHHDLAPWNLVVGDQWAFFRARRGLAQPRGLHRRPDRPLADRIAGLTATPSRPNLRHS